MRRVWSTDWWTHSAKALDKLHQALSNHLEAARIKSAQQSAVVDVPATSVSGVVSDEDAVDDPTREEGKKPEVSESPTRSLEAGGFHDRVMLPSQASHSAGPDRLGVPSAADGQYVFANLDQECYRPDLDQFYSADYEKRLAAMIDHVIDTEGPVHEDVLIKRIARHHGVQRISNQFRETVAALAQRRRGRTIEEDIEARFFWRKGTVKEKLAPARYEGRDEELKDLNVICKEELRSIHVALKLGDDPFLLARRLGAIRISQAVKTRLEKVLRR